MRQTFLFLLLVLATSCWAKADLLIEVGGGYDLPGKHHYDSSYYDSGKFDTDAGYNGYIEFTGMLGSESRLGGGFEVQSERSYNRVEDCTTTFSAIPFYACFIHEPRLSESLRVMLAIHVGWNVFKQHTYDDGPNGGTTYYALGAGLSHKSGLSAMLLTRRHNWNSGLLSDGERGNQINFTLRLGYRFSIGDLRNIKLSNLRFEESPLSKYNLQCMVVFNRYTDHRIKTDHSDYSTEVMGKFCIALELLRQMTDRLKAGVGIEFQQDLPADDDDGHDDVTYKFKPVYACAIYKIPSELRVTLEAIAHIGYADFDCGSGYYGYYAVRGEPKGGFYGGLGIGVTDKSGLTVNVMYRVNYGSIDYDNGWSNGTARITQNQFVIRFGYRL